MPARYPISHVSGCPLAFNLLPRKTRPCRTAGVPRLLEHMFGGVMAGRRLRVINVAERGVPLYAQSVAFERALAARNPAAPGVVLIMSGHNDPFVPTGDLEADLAYLQRLYARFTRVDGFATAPDPGTSPAT